MTKELNGTKIATNCAAPGAVATETFFSTLEEELVKECINDSPLLRLREPKDIAAVIGFLMSNDGEWVNGQVVPVNGGA
ncbi:hypothetical protein Ancab_039100 [Ancistrocladus abbreviatus]